MQYLIGVDIGTTNVKAIAVANDNRLLAQASRPTHTFSPFHGAAEQSAEAVYHQVLAVIREATGACPSGYSPAGIVFSAAMHSLVAADIQGNALTKAWLWSDLRARPVSDTLRSSGAGQELYRRTGTPIHPMSPLVKICWMRQYMPQVFEKAATFLGIKDFVLHQLLGEKYTDASVASATGLLNTLSGKWDDLALDTCGIGKHQLPAVLPPLKIMPLPAKTADLLGLPQGLPLIPGASDGALANIGSGASGPETLAITIGTSGALRLTLNQPFFDPMGRTFCYRVDGTRFIAGGASNNGSNVFDWLRKQILHTRARPEQLLAAAAAAKAGCDGLLFLPYLHGERAPVWDPTATGIFYGLQAHHNSAQLLRAAIEGVVFNLKLIAQALPQMQAVTQIAFSGGAARSELWQQVLADVFQLPVHVSTEDRMDASAFGAIVLARLALGLPELPEQAAQARVLPVGANVEIYSNAFGRFAQLCTLKI